jgi:hypothetical protein
VSHFCFQILCMDCVLGQYLSYSRCLSYKGHLCSNLILSSTVGLVTSSDHCRLEENRNRVLWSSG